MKIRSLRSLLTYGLLIFVSSFVCANSVTPKYTIRSQGTNAARRLAGSVDHVMLYDMENWYGTLSVTPEYTRSFNRKGIAECLFGDKLCDKRLLRIQGSRVTDRDPNALLADYFYLPTDFSSEVEIRPLIQNFLVDFNYYLGLDEWVEGMYLWIQAPVTWTKWGLNYKEHVFEEGTNDHVAGYFTANTLTRDNLLNNFSEFAIGKAPGNGMVTTTTGKKGVLTDFNTAFQGLDCARICSKSQTKTAVSEVRFALGHNCWLEEDYHLGLNFQVSIPTGNNTKSTFLFTPQNGNDRHWEVGGGLSASYVFWRSEDEEQQCGFYFDANITHMFKHCQKRCFDLCDQPLSRYMLAEKMTSDISDNLVGSPDELAASSGTVTTPNYQFDEEYAPVANITALHVDVSIAVNADIVAMFNYLSGNWSFDFGYNFWGRSCEKIKLKCDCTPFESNTWALKGDAHVYGFMDDDDAPYVINDPIALSATMSKATICGGKNFGRFGVATGSSAESDATKNPRIDNPEFAYAGPSEKALDDNPDAVNNENTRTSIQPILITEDDINFARTKGISHKIFSHLSYTWSDRDDWLPYLGIGLEAEFGSNGDNCKDSCDSGECSQKCKEECSTTRTTGNCSKCSLSQWGLWLKGGISFR